MTHTDEARLLAEGQRARRDGMSWQDCPYRDSMLHGDSEQRLQAVTWLRGYFFRSDADDS